MPATATTPQDRIRAAAGWLEDIDNHLTRYHDPARLTGHLRSGLHGWTVHAAAEDDLFTLTADHRIAHQDDIAAARAALADAEDAAADAHDSGSR